MAIMNKTKIYNTGKAVTRDELKCLIKKSRNSGDWSKVEQANVSEVTDMFRLFEGVKGISDLNLDGWDTSSVTNMGYIFDSSDCNYPLRFDTSNVTSMRYMFFNSVYSHPLHFDTSNVEDMCSMFYKSRYNHPLFFDTSNVTNMSFMFRDSRYNQPLYFDTSNVTNIRYMFYNSEYNHPLALDASNVKSMGGIFDNSSITYPITFTGGNIPDDVQSFVDENNITYDENCKLDNAIQNKRDDTSHNSAIVSSFKL